MKKPLWDVRSSVLSVEMSHTVRTAMSWHVWVPVGSSSRITSFGAEALLRVECIWARMLDLFSGGKLDIVSSKGRGLWLLGLEDDIGWRLVIVPHLALGKM